MEYSLLHQRVQGESVPNKDPAVSEGPVLYSHYITGYTLATSLLYVTEFYKQVLGEQAIRLSGESDDCTLRGCFMVNPNRDSLTSTTVSICCLQGRVHQQWFPHSCAGFRPSLHPAFQVDDKLQDGVSPALLTLAPTLPPLDAHLIFSNGHQSWVGIVHGGYVTAAGLSSPGGYTLRYTLKEYKAPKLVIQ